jgi:hypothetical protein
MTVREILARRLLERGVAGTACVLSVTRTNEVSRSPDAGWHAPWVYRFVLRVSIPGRPEYNATCRLYAPGITQGATVRVAASPRNSRRITIDLGSRPVIRGDAVINHEATQPV